jgi:hypothetical protein
MGVWKANPVGGNLTELVASTTSDTALLTSTGARSSAISGGTQVSGGIWTPTVGQFYFIGVLCVTAASAPTLVTPGQLNSTWYNLGGANNAPMTARFAGQSDLPASVTTPALGNGKTPLVVGIF